MRWGGSTGQGQVAFLCAGVDGNAEPCCHHRGAPGSNGTPRVAAPWSGDCGITSIDDEGEIILLCEV